MLETRRETVYLFLMTEQRDFLILQSLIRSYRNAVTGCFVAGRNPSPIDDKHILRLEWNDDSVHCLVDFYS